MNSADASTTSARKGRHLRSYSILRSVNMASFASSGKAAWPVTATMKLQHELMTSLTTCRRAAA